MELSKGIFPITDNGVTVLTNYKPASGREVFLNSGNGTNTVAINDSGTTPDAFTLGTGYLTFAGTSFVPQGPVSWTINGNSGNDTYTLSGTPAANIIAGNGNNTFKVLSRANLLGSITAGTGKNTLDYSGYATSGVIYDTSLTALQYILNEWAG